MTKNWKIELVFQEEESERGGYISRQDLEKLLKFVCNKVEHESQGRVKYNFQIMEERIDD